ncbi:MAG: beta-1,6-N-acetylglucosaminyltransferase, partial [Oscillospiraceae bacterium]|nr:beta-1,6-N-acetylglucosaminyltransferase [Oscillospiraceae bacterium]
MKHAYLIMAHNEFALLKRQLHLLDHPENDIFLHIDKKVPRPQYEALVCAVVEQIRHAGVQFLPRRRVAWGGSSQIRLLLALFRAASRTQHAYYHVMAGVDLPNKPHDKILRFFAESAGKNYMEFCPVEEDILDRVRYYYPLQNVLVKRCGSLGWYLQKALVRVQKQLAINRARRAPFAWAKGSNRVSVTHEFVLGLLGFYAAHRRRFRMVYLADELVVQSFALQSGLPLEDDYLRFCLWIDHKPHTLTQEDYEALVASPALFALKYSCETQPAIVE